MRVCVLGIWGDGSERDGGGGRGICDLVEEIVWTTSPGFDEIRKRRVQKAKEGRLTPHKVATRNTQYKRTPPHPVSTKNR
jgi:hypothetical protein